MNAAEQKAARLEEMVARQIDEKAQFAKDLIRWQDTVKLRDQAIERKEQRIKELQADLQKASSEAVLYRNLMETRDEQLEAQSVKLLDLEAAAEMQGGIKPENISYRAILEAEVKARKAAQEELRVVTKSMATMQAAYHESLTHVAEFLRLFKPGDGG